VTPKPSKRTLRPISLAPHHCRIMFGRALVRLVEIVNYKVKAGLRLWGQIRFLNLERLRLPIAY